MALTPTPCARRLHNLERAGVIGAYVALLDQAKVGLPVTAFVEVKLTREHEDEALAFEAAVRTYPEVMECYAMSGGYDYLLRVVVADLAGYHAFLRERLLALRMVDAVQTGFALDRVVHRTSLPLSQLGQ